MVELILFVISIIPVIFLGGYIYKKDKNKEPAKLLIKLFLAGIFSCFLVLIVTRIVEFVFPVLSFNLNESNLLGLFVYAFIKVALVEEFCKWIMSYSISYTDRNFEEIYDMMIYCIFVALGFAFIENLLYVYQGGLYVGILRALLAVPGHACDGVFMGYFLGLAKQAKINSRTDIEIRNILFSILVPTIIHGIYDFCLFASSYAEIYVFEILFYPFVIVIDVWVIKKVKVLSSIGKNMHNSNQYCSNCGVLVDANFCSNCGKQV